MATPATTATQGSTKIPLLTDKNYTTWLIDIRAILRKAKLWLYTQYSYDELKKHYKDVTKAQYDEYSMEAADTLVPTISTSVKQRLSESHFDNGYLLLSRLRELLQPIGDIQFMRLTRELYSLQLGHDETPSELLTRLKILEEHIDATKMELTADKRTLLALTMALATTESYGSLVQIWQSLPDMTAERARQMLLEEEHIQKAREDTAVRVNYMHKKFNKGNNGGSGTNGNNNNGGGGPPCDTCQKTGHSKDICWEEHPELAPDWLQSKLRAKKAKRDGNNSGGGVSIKGIYDVQ